MRESIGTISLATVNRIVETGDLDDIAARYPDYAIYRMQAECFDAADPDATPMTGTFVTVFLCRKEMRFNCNTRRRRE